MITVRGLDKSLERKIYNYKVEDIVEKEFDDSSGDNYEPERHSES